MPSCSAVAREGVSLDLQFCVFTGEAYRPTSAVTWLGWGLFWWDLPTTFWSSRGNPSLNSPSLSFLPVLISSFLSYWMFGPFFNRSEFWVLDFQFPFCNKMALPSTADRHLPSKPCQLQVPPKQSSPLSLSLSLSWKALAWHFKDKCLISNNLVSPQYFNRLASHMTSRSSM